MVESSKEERGGLLRLGMIARSASSPLGITLVRHHPFNSKPLCTAVRTKANKHNQQTQRTATTTRRRRGYSGSQRGTRPNTTSQFDCHCRTGRALEGILPPSCGEAECTSDVAIHRSPWLTTSAWGRRVEGVVLLLVAYRGSRGGREAGLPCPLPPPIPIPGGLAHF